MVEDRARDGRLHELLQQYHSSRTNRVIIFVLYKKEAVRVEQHLTRKGWKVRHPAAQPQKGVESTGLGCWLRGGSRAA